MRSRPKRSRTIARAISAIYSTPSIAANIPAGGFAIQVMTQAQAEAFRWNPFDLTKVWPHKEFPLIEVGVLELNRNPMNYFAEVEQAAFKPSALVPGIGPSPDKMLQARLVSYADAHLHRLRRQSPAGARQQAAMPGDELHSRRRARRPAIMAGSQTTGPTACPERRRPILHTPIRRGNLARRSSTGLIRRVGHDDFTQPGNLYRLFDEGHRDRLTTRIAGGLGQARREVQLRQLCHFFRADPDYGQRVARKLGIDLSELQGLAELKGETRQPVSV